MRLLTGKDREEYELALQRCASYAAEAEQLRDRLEELQATLKRVDEERVHERQRADNAVDALLAVRGVPPITPLPSPPEYEDPLREDPEEVARIEADMVKHGIGAVLPGAADGV
jgi:hypothetical protein